MSICFSITDVDWEVTKDVFSVLGTVVSAIGVCAVFWIGWQGLTTWRKQLKGVGDHDLARKILIELYFYRESIKRVRNPGIWAHETSPSESVPTSPDPEQENFNQLVRAYDRRLTSVDEARAPLRASLIEAEAIWGLELHMLIKKLLKLDSELARNIRSYLNSQNPSFSEDYRARYLKIFQKSRDIVHDTMDDGDEYTSELTAAVSEVEKYLKPKLLR
jgi:uncharacterized protein YeaO (DUF488 family)